MERRVSVTNPDFYYFTSGEKPRLLVHTGTHGDEWESIDLVKKATERVGSGLPSFVYFPEVSPSAVAARTRVNSFGHDINRIFSTDSDDPEVVENIRPLIGKRLALLVSFHEDVGVDYYYVYDTGLSEGENLKVLKHNKKLAEAGIKLFSGTDDPADPNLGYIFKDGYRKFVHKKGDPHNGFIVEWLLNNGVVTECLNPEIPGNLDTKTKKFIIESFFEDVLIGK